MRVGRRTPSARKMTWNFRRILISVLEGAALLPVSAGAAYGGAAVARGSLPPIHWALLLTGSMGLVAGWYTVLRRAELSKRGARLVAIGALSGLFTVAGLFAVTVVPILTGILAGTTSPDATDLVVFLLVVYGAPLLVAIAEWPRIRRGLPWRHAR